MSKQAQLPPRCPFQKKPISRPSYDPASSTLFNNEKLYPHHHKSASQSSILEGQPPWLDDLLNDSTSNSKGTFHRRSASDSTLLDGLVHPVPSLTTPTNEENTRVHNPCSGLESACTYGPNSPRCKNNLSFSENAVASALSDYVAQSPPKIINGNLYSPGLTHSVLKADGFGMAREIDAETKASKRHSGQRSRVRKLQYIAELERTVDVFQALESELSVRVASLLQQRVSLSTENSKLKQQVARLGQEKSIVEGQYQQLRREVLRLKTGVANSRNSNSAPGFESSPTTEASFLETSWQMVDLRKLNI